MLTLALLPLLCGAATPEPRQGLPASLSDEEAVALALRENPALRAFRREREVAEGQIVSATAMSNPTLRLEALHVQESDPSRLGWGLQLKWAPPQPFEWIARRAGSRARLDEVRHEIAEREWMLAVKVRETCAALREIGEQGRLAEAALGLRQRVAVLQRARLARGAATRIEQNLADLSVVRAQQAVDEVELRRALTQAEFHALLGVLSVDPIAIKGVGDELHPEVAPDPAALTQQALSTRPALRAAYARQAQRQQQVRIEQARRWPWIELSGRYRQNQLNSYPHDVQLGVDMTLPLLSTNAGPLRVAEAARGREQASAEAQAHALTQALYAACAELKARGVILLRFQREFLSVLVEHERLMEIAARGAEVDLSALLGSEEVVLRGRRDYSEARFGYRRAWLALEAAAGKPLREAAP